MTFRLLGVAKYDWSIQSAETHGKLPAIDYLCLSWSMLLTIWLRCSMMVTSSAISSCSRLLSSSVHSFSEEGRWKKIHKINSYTLDFVFEHFLTHWKNSRASVSLNINANHRYYWIHVQHCHFIWQLNLCLDVQVKCIKNYTNLEYIWLYVFWTWGQTNLVYWEDTSARTPHQLAFLPGSAALLYNEQQFTQYITLDTDHLQFSALL